MKTTPPSSWQTLRDPIQTKNPTGCDVRKVPELQKKYQTMKELRTQARNLERRYYQQLDANNKSPAYWEKVQSAVLDLLKNDTKDLELIAWLIESALRLQGFPKWLESVELAISLLEHYGALLHPQPDEEGWLTPCAALRALDGQENEGSLIPAIYAQVFGEGSINEEGCLTVWNKRTAADQTTYLSLTEKLILAYKNLDHVFSEIAPDIIQNKNILKALHECKKYLEIVSKKTTKSVAKAENKTEIPTSPEIATLSVDTNRDQVLEQLKEIAKYFLQHEPHSPIPYLLQRAIDWGGLSLPELLKEWITDDTERQRLQRFVGIPPKLIIKP